MLVFMKWFSLFLFGMCLLGFVTSNNPVSLVLNLVGAVLNIGNFVVLSTRLENGTN